MDAFLTVMSRYAVVIDVMAQHSPYITALVWGALRLLIMVGESLSKPRNRYFACIATHPWIYLPVPGPTPTAAWQTTQQQPVPPSWGVLA